MNLPRSERAVAAPRARLLVVDDQPANIRLLHALFSEQHEVFMATGGAQALSLCQTILPDLVLLDVDMPGMDGLSVCRQLRAMPETCAIPVIFVTGSDGVADESDCWDAGCVDFVNKPVNVRTLRNRVDAHLQLKRQADQLRALAFTDGLTGLTNRRHFEDRLQQAWTSCARDARPCAALMLDIDWFKRYNDTYGHQAGDDCLRQVASAMAAQLRRPDDVLARYGGEEFVCLLPGTDLAGAQRVAQALETAVRACAIVHGGADSGIVSISIGVAALQARQDNSGQELIALADAQLYQAKRAGRGCWRATG